MFNTALGASNIDTIRAFNVIDDTIRLDDAIFVGVAKRWLSADAFEANMTGTATCDQTRITYDTATGRLYFDADGSGSAERDQFAIVTPNLAITHADFFVF